jgi:hypothetical protein
MFVRAATVLACTWAVSVVPAHAQISVQSNLNVSDPIVAGPAENAAQPSTLESEAEVVIPALTPVEIVIDADIDSKKSKSGETFPIHLAKPIVIDGVDLVPAGATGAGEIVHAKKGGGSGAPGELVLAARYLEVGERRLLLRSMRVSGVGTDNIGMVDGLAIASAASPVPVALLGFIITGGEKRVPEGSVAKAKTSADFPIEPVESTPAARPSPTPVNSGEEAK